MKVDYHSWDSAKGVQKYLNQRKVEGWTLHSVTPTGKWNGNYMVLMYIWVKQNEI